MRLIAGGTKNPIVNPRIILIARTRINSWANPVIKIVADHTTRDNEITAFRLNLSLTAPAMKLEMISGTIKAGPFNMP